MRVLGKKILTKLQAKNKSNRRLCSAIDQLIKDLEQFNPTLALLETVRDIHIHRTFILIDLDEDGEAVIIWAGSHDEYERTFKNNKSTIEKWLRYNGYIE